MASLKNFSSDISLQILLHISTEYCKMLNYYAVSHKVNLQKASEAQRLLTIAIYNIIL